MSTDQYLTDIDIDYEEFEKLFYKTISHAHDHMNGRQNNTLQPLDVINLNGNQNCVR
jgi:hypothetical protein